MPEQSRRNTVIGIAALMLSAATIEALMGRQLWGASGVPGLWSGDIWSSHNSQFVADPYSFTHVTHGILFYAILVLVFPRWSVVTRLLVAVGLESAWEVLENTNFIIERYRAETISLNYYGDSIVNSMADICACMLGFFLASRLPARVTLVGVIALELLLLVWIHDNLAINIVMLLHPSQFLRAWQLGRS